MDLFVYTGIVCELFICDFVYVVLMDLFVDKMVAASLKLFSGMESAYVPSNEHASTTGSNANSWSVRAFGSHHDINFNYLLWQSRLVLLSNEP